MEKNTLDLTLILALWGTIFSTVAITWNVVRDLLDRKKIKVEAGIGFILAEDTTTKVFYLTMTNISRRPLYITGWGVYRKRREGKRGKKGLCIPSPDLPKMLKEGDYNIVYTEDLSIFSYKLIRVHVWDSIGKKWKISRKNFRQLLKTAEETE